MKALGVKEKVFGSAYQKFRTNMHRGKSSPSDFIESIKGNLTMSPKDAIEKWNLALTSLPIIESMHQLVKDLKTKYKVGLLTNIFPGHFDLFYNAGKIPHISFDAIVQSCDIGLAKPEKEIYRLAQMQTGVLASNIFLIDNSRENVAAAQQLGWQGFVFDPKNPIQSANKLREILL